MSVAGVTDMAEVREVPFAADLRVIRRLAGVLPGDWPIAVNGVRVAASIRPAKVVIEGGDDTPITMPRTAFQVVYRDCTVMIDSGMDRETHDSFSTPDKREPYFPEAFAQVQKALADARKLLRDGSLMQAAAPRAGGNTTLAVVATNARLTKVEVNRVALMADDLLKVPFALRLSQAAVRNIKVNLAISLVLKGAFVVAAVVGVATLWMAVLADTGASILVIANALRLLRAD